MEFHVGPYTYTLKIPHAYIYNEFGDELEGCADEARRLIVISRRVDLSRREEVLRHEVEHAWGFHFPTARTDEERAQLAAVIGMQFDRDFADAGGHDALVAMLPSHVMLSNAGNRAERTQTMPNTPMADRTDRRTCGACQCEAMCGSISNGPIEQGVYDAQPWMERWMICPACGVLQVWAEYVRQDQKPSGTFIEVPPPRLLRDAEAAGFLRERSRGERVIVPC